MLEVYVKRLLSGELATLTRFFEITYGRIQVGNLYSFGCTLFTPHFT